MWNQFRKCIQPLNKLNSTAEFTEYNKTGEDSIKPAQPMELNVGILLQY